MFNTEDLTVYSILSVRQPSRPTVHVLYQMHSPLLKWKTVSAVHNLRTSQTVCNSALANVMTGKCHRFVICLFTEIYFFWLKKYLGTEMCGGLVPEFMQFILNVSPNWWSYSIDFYDDIYSFCCTEHFWSKTHNFLLVSITMEYSTNR